MSNQKASTVLNSVSAVAGLTGGAAAVAGAVAASGAALSVAAGAAATLIVANAVNHIFFTDKAEAKAIRRTTGGDLPS